MRTRARPFAIALLAACILAFWLWPRKHSDSNARDTQEKTATHPSQSGRPTGTGPAPVAPSQATPSAQPAAATTSAAPSAAEERQLLRWQVPIDFYGRAVDEHSNAVAGASVTFGWSEFPTEQGARRAVTTTDAEGFFSLHGERGPSLDVWVTKEGYYALRDGHRGFSYTGGGFQPDPQNPVVFRLRKKGTAEPLVHIAGNGLRAMRDFHLALDGTPTEVSLRDGQLAAPGQGDLRVELHGGSGLAGFPSRTSWTCKVSVENGGLLQTDDEFPFLAPDGGYHESDEWRVGATNWTEVVEKRYYLKLRDGDFARVNLRIRAGIPGTAYFRMESWLNPTGSRNLEPAD